MRYVLNGSKKNTGIKGVQIKREPNFNKATLMTPTSIHRNKTKHQN